jgi:hypothetical protein
VAEEKSEWFCEGVKSVPETWEDESDAAGEAEDVCAWEGEELKTETEPTSLAGKDERGGGIKEMEEGDENEEEEEEEQEEQVENENEFEEVKEREGDVKEWELESFEMKAEEDVEEAEEKDGIDEDNPVEGELEEVDGINVLSWERDFVWREEGEGEAEGERGEERKREEEEMCSHSVCTHSLI